MRLSFHNCTEKKTESHKQWPQSYKTSKTISQQISQSNLGHWEQRSWIKPSLTLCKPSSSHTHTRSSSYLYMGMLCLFFVQSSLSLFVCCYIHGLDFSTIVSSHSKVGLTAQLRVMSVLVTCPPLWVSLRPGPLSLSVSPLAAAVLSLLSVPHWLLTALLAWLSLSLASHDPVRTRWALNTHSPLPPPLNVFTRTIWMLIGWMDTTVGLY